MGYLLTVPLEYQRIVAGIAVSVLAGLVFIGLGAAMGRGKREIDRASRDTVVRPTRKTEPVSLKPPAETSSGVEKTQEDGSEDKAADDDDFFLVNPLDQ